MLRFIRALTLLASSSMSVFYLRKPEAEAFHSIRSYPDFHGPF
jgi:hypothetical protein